MTIDLSLLSPFDLAVYRAQNASANIIVHVQCDKEIQRLLIEDDTLCGMGQGYMPYDMVLSQNVTWAMISGASRGEA
jgi:hypothetical protein